LVIRINPYGSLENIFQKNQTEFTKNSIALTGDLYFDVLVEKENTKFLIEL